MAGNLEEARERVRRAHSHLEAIWPRRLTESEEAREAVNDLNEATQALADEINRPDRQGD